MDACMKCLYFCLKVEGSIVGFSVQVHLVPTNLDSPSREFSGEASQSED
jgi:hypothetical protein